MRENRILHRLQQDHRNQGMGKKLPCKQEPSEQPVRGLCTHMTLPNTGYQLQWVYS